MRMVQRHDGGQIEDGAKHRQPADPLVEQHRQGERGQQAQGYAAEGVVRGDAERGPEQPIGRQDAVKVVEADPGGVAGDAPVGEQEPQHRWRDAEHAPYRFAPPMLAQPADLVAVFWQIRTMPWCRGHAEYVHTAHRRGRDRMEAAAPVVPGAPAGLRCGCYQRPCMSGAAARTAWSKRLLLK